MCSESANMFLLVGPRLQKEFSSPEITMKKLMDLMDDYVEWVEYGVQMSERSWWRHEVGERVSKPIDVVN